MKRWVVVIPVVLVVCAGLALVFLVDRSGNGVDKSDQSDSGVDEMAQEQGDHDVNGKRLYDDENGSVEGTQDGSSDEEGDNADAEGEADETSDQSDWVYVPGQNDGSTSGDGSDGNGSDNGEPSIIDVRMMEQKWGYTSVHQMDSMSYEGDTFNFEPRAGLKSGQDGRNLEVHLDYTPPTNPYLNKTVLGFAPYWALDGYYQNYQMEHLSVIAYFAVACYPDGSLVKSGSSWSGWNSAALAGMVQKAHADGVKVVLTITNFDKPSIEALVASSSARSRLITNINSEIQAKGVDGVNIDFEYIGTADSALRSQFSSFIDQVADSVHTTLPGSHVSVDIMATSGINQMIYDVAALGSSSVDSIMVMSYDFHSTSYYAGKKAGPESPLYGDQYWYTVDRSMRDIKAKAPAHKILMGIPYYGLEFPVSGATWLSKNATVVGGGAITTYRNVVDPVFDDWHNASTIQWDAGEKMTWYRYRWPSASTGPDYWQGYYDDPKSLGAKYDYVLNNNLGGVGIWALGYDNGRTELWTTLRDKFSKESILVLFKDGVSRAQQDTVHSALGAQVDKYLADENSVIVRPISKRSLDLINDYRRRSEVRSADFMGPRELTK